MARGQTKIKPDQKLAQDQLACLQHLLKSYGLSQFCRSFVWILRKKAEPGEKQPKGHWNRRLVPFRLNAIQEDLADKERKRNICLKPRQVGLTTYHVNARLYIPAVTTPGTASLLVSQTNSYGAQHFNIVRRTHRYFAKVNPFNDEDPKNEFWRQLHAHLLHTEFSARRELVFDMLDSRLLVDSAQNEEVGQGLPGISHMMATEVARWPRDPEATMANVKESVHKDGTVDIESTPNGMGGYFFEEWQRATSQRNAEFTPHFYPWTWQEEYRDDPAPEEEPLTDEEKEIQKLMELDIKQVLWRRHKLTSLRTREFKEKYPEDPISCFVTSGNKFFDDEIVYKRILETQNVPPLEFSDDGSLQIFRRRNKHRQYVIGGDPATGVNVTSEATDYCAAVVLDVESGEEVASYQCRVTPEEFAVVIYDLARLYNDALVAVERTGDGGTVMLQLSHLGYTNIYMHTEWDKGSRQLIKRAGWPASKVTRPIACNKLAQHVRENPELVHDVLFLHEAMTFVRNPKNGRPEAVEGTHDDTVSARYIGHYVRLVLLGYIDPAAAYRERYGESPDDEPEQDAA